MIISFSKGKAYFLFITFCFAFASIRLFFGSVFKITGIEVLGESLFYIIFVGLFLFSLSYILHSVKLLHLVLWGIWVIYCYFMAKGTDRDTDLYIKQVIYIAIMGLLYYIAGRSIRENMDLIRQNIYYLPATLNLMGIINYILIGTNNNYTMELSYANLSVALISTVIIFAGDVSNLEANNYFAKKKRSYIYYTFNLVISYILVFLGGSRGPLMTLVIVAFFSTLYSIKRKKNMLIIIFFLITVAFGMLLIFFGGNVLFENLQSIRFISMLNNGELFSGSGREHYIENALQGIKQNKLFGLGVFHDRVFLFNCFHRDYALNSLGSYPHNVFLEFLLQFGVPLGLLISYILIKKIRYVYRVTRDEYEAEVFFIMFGVGFLPLLVSKSYVQTWEFYMFAGFLSSFNNTRRLIEIRI